MKYRALVACLPLVAGVIFMACSGDNSGDNGGDNGGDSGRPLDEYFNQVEPFFLNAAQLSTASRQQLPDKLAAAQSTEERILVFQEALGLLGSAFASLSGQLQPVKPPEKAKAAQAEVQTTTQALLDLYRDLWDRGQTIETEDDLGKLLPELDGPEITAAEKQQAEACSKLQAVAKENHLDVDLACPSD